MKIRVEMDHPKFIVCKNSINNYQFDLVTGRGKVLLRSRGWVNRELCLEAIKSIQQLADMNHHYMRKEAEDGRFYILMEGQGKPLGFSQMFSTPEALEHSIKMVKSQAPMASLLDFT